jgi:xanthine dehydrogenase YagR molybdenum-binding subunit
VEFRLKNMTRKFRDEQPYTSCGLEDCIRRGAQAIDWKARWRPAPEHASLWASASNRRNTDVASGFSGTNADVASGRTVSGMGMAMGMFGSRVGRSSAVIRLDGRGHYHLHVAVTDVGTGAKTTMALIAAEELGVPLSQIDVVSGDTDRCPYSVGESGSRTTNFTGIAVIEAARDLKKQIAEKGTPKGNEVLIASATPEPSLRDARYSFAAHFAAVDIDLETGHVRVAKYVAAHDSGRIVNPLTATSQVKGGATQGIGMALHEELLYDRRSGLPLNAGYYGARVMTHPDAPDVEVIFVHTEDAYGPFGAKTLGEPPIIPSVAAIANAIFNATGVRIKSLPITRDKVLGQLTS